MSGSRGPPNRGATHFGVRPRPRFPFIAGMARPLRFLTPDAALVEVTLRTVHGRLLLRPSRGANDLVAGVIGRAQRKYAMKIHGLAVLSNHVHLLLSPE